MTFEKKGYRDVVDSMVSDISDKSRLTDTNIGSV